MNDEKYTELTRKAHKNEDADLIMCLNRIAELKNALQQTAQRLKEKDDELEEAFSTALKMYRNPDKARDIFIEVYGDFDNNG